MTDSVAMDTGILSYPYSAAQSLPETPRLPLHLALQCIKGQRLGPNERSAAVCLCADALEAVGCLVATRPYLGQQYSTNLVQCIEGRRQELQGVGAETQDENRKVDLGDGCYLLKRKPCLILRVERRDMHQVVHPVHLGPKVLDQEVEDLAVGYSFQDAVNIVGAFGGQGRLARCRGGRRIMVICSQLDSRRKERSEVSNQGSQVPTF